MADTAQHLDIGRVLNNTFGVIKRNPLIFWKVAARRNKIFSVRLHMIKRIISAC